MDAYLRVTAGPDVGRKFDLTEGLILTIGRGEKSDTKLTDGSVSRSTAPSTGQTASFCSPTSKASAAHSSTARR